MKLLLLSILLSAGFTLGVSAAEPAFPLVTWTNSTLGDDGVLEAAVTATGGVSIDAAPSTFSPALKATKDGVGEIAGNSVVLNLDDRKDHSSETIADAVKAGHFAEFVFKVSGLADGSVLLVTELSYEARPNSSRGAKIHGAIMRQAWISGMLVGDEGRHELGKVTAHAARGLDLALHNGDMFTARLYLAGFDNEAIKGTQMNPFHSGIQFGNVQVFGHVDGPVKLTAFPPEVHAVLQKHCFACQPLFSRSPNRSLAPHTHQPGKAIS